MVSGTTTLMSLPTTPPKKMNTQTLANTTPATNPSHGRDGDNWLLALLPSQQELSEWRNALTSRGWITVDVPFVDVPKTFGFHPEHASLRLQLVELPGSTTVRIHDLDAGGVSTKVEAQTALLFNGPD